MPERRFPGVVFFVSIDRKTSKKWGGEYVKETRRAAVRDFRVRWIGQCENGSKFFIHLYAFSYVL